MSDPTPPADDRPAPAAPRRAGETAFLPIGIVFLVIGLTRLREGTGAAFFVLGIVFLGLSAGVGRPAVGRGARPPADDAGTKAS